MENKNLITVLAIVAIVGLVVAVYSASMTGLAAGGNGRAKGDSCMKGCMIDFGQTGEYFDTQSDLTQFCLTQCNPAQDNAQCGDHADGCCTPFSGDPDCTGASGAGATCPLTDEFVQNQLAGAVSPSYYRSTGADGTEVCHVSGSVQIPAPMPGLPPIYAIADFLISTGSTFVKMTGQVTGGSVNILFSQSITQEEYNACVAVVDAACNL